MRRALVTGGTGFVGSNLARRLLVLGDEVHLVVRPNHNPWRIEEIRQKVRLEQADLTDKEGVARVVARVRPTWVFHLAVYGAYPFQTDVARMVQTNLLGTAHLLEACRSTGVEAFVQAGSSSEYGFVDHAASEEERLEPNSPYAVTKAAATQFCRQAARETGRPLTTLRPYSVYGPYEEPTRLIPTLIREGLAGRLPPLAHPETARDFVYVEDVLDAFLTAASATAEEPGAVFNVGTGVQTTLREAVEIARRTFGLTAVPQWETMPPRRWDTSVWISDCRRIRERLGWRPEYTFEEGFGRTVEWARRNPQLISVPLEGARV